MKQYCNSILLVFVIFLCIGTFYIHSAALANPQFVFKKQSGNENEAKSVAIYGYFQNERNERLMDNVKISSEGTIYDSELSVLGQIEKELFGYDGFDEELKKEYRSFMRGKTGVNSFYEDEEFLVYTNVSNKILSTGQPDIKFKISMLEKDTKAEKSFNIQVPNENRYQFINVEDVQMFGNKLKILSRNFNVNDQELHVYTLDLGGKKVEDDKTVLPPNDKRKNLYTDFQKLGESDNTQPNPFVFYYKGTTKDVEQQDGSFISEPVGSELIKVNLETNQAEKIAIPKELQESISLNPLPYYDSKMMYFALETKEGIKVVSFDHRKENVENIINLKSHQLKAYGELTFNVKDRKVYVLTSPEKVGQDPQPANLIIADLKTGEQLYKGIISIKDHGNKTTKMDGFVTLDRLIVE